MDNGRRVYFSMYQKTNEHFNVSNVRFKGLELSFELQ